MLYFPNTLPSFAKMLIGFHDIYRRICKNIYPWLKSKNLFSEVDGSAQNQMADPFPDPVGHFGTSWQSFGMFEVLKEGIIESKNLFSES